MNKIAVAALFGVAFSLGAAAHADTYKVDSENSVIEFQYKQMGVNMKGSFANLQGTITFDEAEPDKMAAQIELPWIQSTLEPKRLTTSLLKPSGLIWRTTLLRLLSLRMYRQVMRTNIPWMGSCKSKVKLKS